MEKELLLSTENPEVVAESPEATVTELAKPEDVTAYVEERREQEAEDAPKDKDEAELSNTVKDFREKHGLEDKKKASRYERLKRARDAAQAEAADLRRQLGERETPSPKISDSGAIETDLRIAGEKHGSERVNQACDAFINHVQQTGDKATYHKVMSSPDIGEALVEWFDNPETRQAAFEQGRAATEFDLAVAERVSAERAAIETQAQVKARTEIFAQSVPDYFETVGTLGVAYRFPPAMVEMIAKTDIGPAIMYGLGKLAESNGHDYLSYLEQMEDPIQIAREVGRMESALNTGIQRGRGGPAPRTATKAPAPLTPVKGGSSGPKDLHSLAAQSDDISAYAQARGRE